MKKSKERIQVYTEDTDLKQRVQAVKGAYSESLFCFQAIEEKVAKIEKARRKVVK